MDNLILLIMGDFYWYIELNIFRFRKYAALFNSLKEKKIIL